MIIRGITKDLPKYINSENIFVFLLMLLAIGLPVAPFLVSMSQGLLIVHWVFQGSFKLKINRLKSNRDLHFFLLIFFVHLIWLFNTTNYSYALHDIKIKLPLLILPIILSTGNVLSNKQLKSILLIFSSTVIVATFISLWIFMGYTKIEVIDIRDISIFVSHIRFGLMIVFSIGVVAYYFYLDYEKLSISKRIVYVIVILWKLFFLLILQSVTSWVILFLLMFLLVFKYHNKLKSKFLRYFSLASIIVGPIALVSLVSIVVYNFYNVDDVNVQSLPKTTKLGNKYRHDLNSKLTENGHFVHLYQCTSELKDNWSKYSKIPFDAKDAKGQSIHATLVRYLTSKNLPKDAEGLSKLDKDDVEMIESGYANYIYRSNFTPYIKLYELLWELNTYYLNNNPNAKTTSMRIEFFKAGIGIFKNNVIFGIGTGDLQDSFNEYYEKTNTNLKPKYRLRAHNQYLTFLISFGVVGFIIVVFGFYKSFILNKVNFSPIVFVFICIMLLSMINEDTLETQSGATIFAYFYSLLVLRTNKERN